MYAVTAVQTIGQTFTEYDRSRLKKKQEGLAVASIARDDPSRLPGDDLFPGAGMHRDRNAR